MLKIHNKYKKMTPWRKGERIIVMKKFTILVQALNDLKENQLLQNNLIIRYEFIKTD